MQRKTQIAVTSAIVAGGLFLAGLTGTMLAQSAGGTPDPPGWMPGMMGGAGTSMHGQLTPEQVQQMQQWHTQQGGAGMMGATGMMGRMGMMGGQSPAQMHAQLPSDLQAQMDAMHAQMPAALQQTCHGDANASPTADQ